ncbi:hypothetical protein PGT21_020613 [Puccinia graminis f. sp. tritici]|uniref:Uncharacterized protein n=2 Tax=Puccinia graminis f. sp. tritici TaxID=56615 RepID=E3KFB1_PUCGT|nr:uncharacterized protein PGTG_09906 [Puccinia graminis f. sp. tritici CRL 75-36-700-3]EFP82938.1 hypothetical protein PGTG_09906 [Puccinia graminis f. sp. tritici CRL 75-36-700-3]KAA1069313.1 hypothetical protein PGT21_020613 [Puccinia graminis f. sp. tritici]
MRTPFIVSFLILLLIGSASLTLPTSPGEKTIIIANDGNELPDLNGPSPGVELSPGPAFLWGPNLYNTKVPKSSSIPSWEQMRPAASRIPGFLQETISLGLNPSGSRKRATSSVLVSDRPRKRPNNKQDLVQVSIEAQASKLRQSGTGGLERLETYPEEREQMRPAAFRIPGFLQETISLGLNPSGSRKRATSSVLVSDRPKKRPNNKQDLVQVAIEAQASKLRESGPGGLERLETYPEEILESGKQLKEDDIGRGKQVTEPLPPMFKVYDWDFLKARGTDGIMGNHKTGLSYQDRKLEYLFRTFEFQETDGFFWVRPTPRELSNIKKIFNKQRYIFRRNYRNGPKTRLLSELVLNLSDEKLALDRYPTFIDDMLDFERRMKARLNNIHNGASVTSDIAPLPRKVAAVSKYVSNMTKIVTFLTIFHLSLFKQHVGEKLTQKAVEEILVFVRDFWLQLELPNRDLLGENPWVTQISQMLRLEDEPATDYGERYRTELWYHKAWKIVQYWAEQNKKPLISKDGPESFPVELVNNMLMLSNPSYFP